MSPRLICTYLYMHFKFTTTDNDIYICVTFALIFFEAKALCTSWTLLVLGFVSGPIQSVKVHQFTIKEIFMKKNFISFHPFTKRLN